MTFKEFLPNFRDLIDLKKESYNMAGYIFVLQTKIGYNAYSPLKGLNASNSKRTICPS